MCGIIGSVGNSTDPALSFQLMTNLLRETKVRGKDATGHFMVDENGDSALFKLPVDSEVYIKLDPWKQTIRGTRALLGHCRWTTHGTAKNNKNNHPFTSSGGNIALIHNGKLDDYDKYKKEFELETECDSEILLHTIIEEKNILKGIIKIYKTYGPGGDFACMVVLRHPGTSKTRLFVFREPGRTVVFYDCTEQLGQYIFCSTEDIWKKAITEAKLTDLLKNVKPVNVPSYEIWEIDSEDMVINKTKVENITRRTSYVHYGSENWIGRGYANTSSVKETKTKTNTNTSPISLASDPDLLEKLGPGWEKEINESGQLVLTFDSQKAESDENKKIEKETNLMDVHRELVLEAVKDPGLRWLGWEEEAARLGVEVPLDVSDISTMDEAMDAKVMDAYLESIS